MAATDTIDRALMNMVIGRVYYPKEGVINALENDFLDARFRRNKKDES